MEETLHLNQDIKYLIHEDIIKAYELGYHEFGSNRNKVCDSCVEKRVVQPQTHFFGVEQYPGLDYRIDETSILGTGRTTISTVVKTPVVVSYKDESIVTKAFWYETDMDLTEKDKPYIEFQKLQHDLGHGIEPGIYNVKIHLPESYEFTEIK
ncbi:hypothetical protein KLEB273_gp094 [Bacillus phage vB_BauM_KLEB27-3]|nr:hypothetical protein KLEB273_gp094 [Bacillus phage vB_BauM_KLEB27-3]